MLCAWVSCHSDRLGERAKEIKLRTPRQVLWSFAKRRLRPALDRFLARYSILGDPVVFDNELFPWRRKFEERIDEIRVEAMRLSELHDALPTFHEVSPYQERISNDLWRTVYLYGFGYRSEVASELCPVTANLLDEVPGLQSALFSLLAPGMHIKAHRGFSKSVINYHLGVIVPKRREQCRMRIADREIVWEAGKSIVFDDTNLHEVWNDSGEERIVLLVQFDRPLRSPGRQVSQLFMQLLVRLPYLKEPRRRVPLLDARLRKAAVTHGLLPAAPR